MELADYLRILRKYWRSVAAVTLATLLLAALFSLVSKPTYTSNSTIFLSIRNASTAGELNAGSSYVENQAQSFAKVAKTPIVLQPVIDQLSLDTTPEQLAGSITATIPTNTATIDLSVVRGDPAEAAAIASAVSDRLIVVVAATGSRTHPASRSGPAGRPGYRLGRRTEPDAGHPTARRR